MELGDIEPVGKRKKFCDECDHMHRVGMYCHVYCELDEDDDGNEDEEADGNSDGDDDNDGEEDGASLGLDAPNAKAKKKQDNRRVIRPLTTPAFVKAIRFIRCNCRAGVPSNNSRFEPIPLVVNVGPIRVQLYDEITDPSRGLKEKMTTREQEIELRKIARRRKAEAQSSVIPFILDFLKPGQCSEVPKVSTLWRKGANQCKMYTDFRDCVPRKCYRPHSGQVDSLVIYNNRIFSGGDRRIVGSEFETGKTLGVVTRESGDVPVLLQRDGELFSCSTTGSIRVFTIAHTVANCTLVRTMWDHSRAVSTIAFDFPTVGPCPMHGMEAHVCLMFTTSEDRTLRVWNTSQYTNIKTIQAKSLKTASFTCLTHSDRHLFAGTSKASIAVFTKQDYCERDDVHQCSNPGADKTFCLQVALKLPPNLTDSGNEGVVTGVLVCGPDGYVTTLWASDSTGQVTLWDLPYEGIDFAPIKTWKAHTRGAVTKMVKTFKHVLTLGDDCRVNIYDMKNLERMKSVDVGSECIMRHLFPRPEVERRLKSVDLREDLENGGILALGTNYGDIIILNLGTSI